MEAPLNKGLYQYRISAEQQNFTDSSGIVYYEKTQKPKADSIADVIKKTLGLNVRTEFIEEIRTPAGTPNLFLNLTPTGTRNSIAINIRSTNLNEIWKGRRSNR